MLIKRLFIFFIFILASMSMTQSLAQSEAKHEVKHTVKHSKSHAKKHHPKHSTKKAAHKTRAKRNRPTPPVNYIPPASFPTTGNATPNSSLFDRQLIYFMHKWRIPGGALAVVRNGQLIYSRGYGWADQNKQVPVHPNSLFRIASVSKLITATTLLKLAQDNKLNLDAHVFDILNNLTPIAGKPVNKQIYQMTVMNLLHMSSGWFRAGPAHLDPMFGPWPKYMVDDVGGENNLPASCETMTRVMMTRPFVYKSGTTYVYSNMDYCMLGLIVDKIVGQNYGYLGYQNYVKANILAPLGITDMAIGNTLENQKLPGEVTYYRYPSESTQELAESTYLPYSDTQLLQKNFANGGWVASAPDLAKFMNALTHLKILDRKYFDIMTAKPAYMRGVNNDYFAMGTKVYHYKDGTTLIQTGSFTGTNAMVVNKPDGTSIAVIFNTRPSMYNFFSTFRPELVALLLSKNLANVA